MSVLQKERDNKTVLVKKTRLQRKWPLISLCVIAAMAVAIATVSIQFVLANQQHRQHADAQSQQLATLEQQLSELEEKLSKQEQDAASRIEEQNKIIKERENKIAKQEQTIKDLKTQIAYKKAQQTPPKKTTATVVTPYTSVYAGDLAGKKLVALTFDDGPGPYTARLLDAMKARGVRATFFVLGSRVSKYPDLIKRMEAEGHVVGNHTQNHKNLARLSATGVKNEIETCAKKVEQLIGHKPVVLRCPGGSCNSTVKAYAKSAGLPILYWDVDTRDWESRNVNAILRKSFQGNNRIQDGSVVLMHDIYSTSVDAAIQMMDRLIKEGYSFVTVPELLSARYGGGEGGKVY